MGKYEDAMGAIIREEFKGARRVTKKNGDDGFKYRIGCIGCKYRGFVPFYGPQCSHDGTDDNIRKVKGGEMCGGKCYEFTSLEQFWDDFSNTHAIDPETGEIYVIY